MIDEKLKQEVLKNGYRLCRIPVHQCSCYMDYPNENYKFKNGKWKCVDKYRPIQKTHQDYIEYPVKRL